MIVISTYKIDKSEYIKTLLTTIISGCILLLILHALYANKDYFDKYNIPIGVSIGCYDCDEHFEPGESCPKCNKTNVQIYAYTWCDNCDVFKNHIDIYCNLCGDRLNKFINLNDTDIDLNDLKQHIISGNILLLLTLLTFIVFAVFAFMLIIDAFCMIYHLIQNATYKSKQKK